MKYKIKEGFQVPVAVDDLVNELERIRAANGELTAAAVVDAARSKRSLLHDCFTWDDKEAAELYRLQEAQYLLRSVAYEEDSDGKELPSINVFAHVNSDKAGVYTSVFEDFNVDARRKQILEDALRELRAWRQKYANLKSLSAVFEQVDAL